MGSIISIVQIIVCIFLVAAIVLQQRGAGLGGAFGGGAESYHVKRGFEKFLFRTTIVLAALFLGLAFLSLFV